MVNIAHCSRVEGGQNNFQRVIFPESVSIPYKYVKIRCVSTITSLITDKSLVQQT